MKKIRSIIYILLSGMLWGCMGLFVRVLNKQGIASMDIVFLRAIVTAVAMVIYLFIFHRKMLKIHWKDFWCFLGTGIASITFFNFCYFKAIMMTSLSVAAVLLYIAPAIVMILSYILFREAFTVRKVIAIVMTFFGCMLVIGMLGQQQAITTTGLLYGLGAGLGYAFYSIFSRYALEKGYHSLTITCYTFIVTTVVSVFFTAVPKVSMVVFSSPSYVMLTVALGLICTVAPYLLYTLGLQEVDNSHAAIIASIEPVTATVLGFVVFGEDITVVKMMGMILVLGGMVVCNKKA
ncbi:MAG: EamA family transporter [Lachnospiraceae bacterium]|nr:EamA family transporter [Lachnospiraceae bacterium]